ncbi:histidine phosphatase superfamily branch 2 protein [Nitzschia inconspicua]|uniref:Histidine phosphatase superfamily branch 2 protein n=1 Tax=Nitzschia inconspicua TaxID=303405 RepID=A0A9K3P798_9STRA|nr:histidine phosphatase superfamily branch 2 protein [Nitzschia inconspicua]KAG7358297.1 histidine phosphatase superfamily branch 2 protein [Nitzschia inconspicua]
MHGLFFSPLSGWQGTEFPANMIQRNPIVSTQILVFLLLLSVTTDVVTAEQKLRQIHVITRHGSRTMLPKDPDSLLEKEGATLTPLGQLQLFSVGEWLRQEYGSAIDLQYYNPSIHLLESSNLDRTLSSANALALGLFPESQRATGIMVEDGDNEPTFALMTSPLETTPAIPVFSTNEDNDVHLRAFRNCPTFQDNLQLLYETNVWKQLESNNEALLRKLAAIFPLYAEEGKVPLKDIWNIYDALNVAVTECSENSTTCEALVPLPSLATALSGQDFAALELVTHQVEHLKYAETETAGNLLGSNLLWKILERASDEEDNGVFYLYSAHAPTILGLLSTLQAAGDFVSVTRGERFVDYGDALVFEVYEELGAGGVTKTLSLKLKYKSLAQSNSVSIPLKQSVNPEPCGGGDDDDFTSICDLEEFTLWSLQHTLIGIEHWCEACGNVYSDVCLRAKYLTEGGQPISDGDWNRFDDREVSNGIQMNIPTDSSNQNDALILAATFLGGLLAGLFIMMLIGFLCVLPRIRNKEVPSPPSDKDGLSIPSPAEVATESAPSNNIDNREELANDDASLSTTGTDHLC